MPAGRAPGILERVISLRRAGIGLLLAAASACASDPPIVEGPRPKQFRPVVIAPPAPDRAPPGKLYREDVVRVVDAGFGEFLQKIEVEPAVRDGRFVGWTVVALYALAFWDDVDLTAGDVVRSVTGLPIERETQVYEAFQALKSAPRLAVTYTRRGRQRALSYEIVARPAPGASVATR